MLSLSQAYCRLYILRNPKKTLPSASESPVADPMQEGKGAVDRTKPVATMEWQACVLVWRRLTGCLVPSPETSSTKTSKTSWVWWQMYLGGSRSRWISVCLRLDCYMPSQGLPF